MKDRGFKRGRVIIEGVVELKGDYSRVITLISPGPVESIRRTEILDSIGNFRFDFEVLCSHDILVRYENGFAQLLVYPGDSLFLSLNAKSFKSEIFPDYRTSGENSETSENIMAYNRFEKQNNFQPDINENMSVSDYLNKIRKQIHLEDSVLNVFIGMNNTKIDFGIWAKKYITYSYANYLIDYKYFHSLNKTRYTGNLFDKNLFPVNDDDAFISSQYGLHLWHYSTGIYMQRDTVVRDLLEEKKLYEANLLCLENIISKEKPGLSRDVMCYRILDALFEKSHSIFMSLWKEDQQFIKDEELISMFQKKNERFQKQKSYKISLLDSKSQKEQEILGDFWNILKKKYKGKVIYIDIWTTWCGPCRSEIPYAIELHEYYKNKPLAFVNICMSSNKDVWEEFIKKNHISGDNYFFNKSQARLFNYKIHFQGYPTYLIIDKNGILIDKSAPRPSSDKQIKAKLDSLLEE